MNSGAGATRRQAIALGVAFGAGLTGCRGDDGAASPSTTPAPGHQAGQPDDGAATTATSTSPATSQRPTVSGTVVVNLGARRQTIDGFGFSTRVWTDPHLSDAPETVVPDAARSAILELLISDLGITRIRPNIDAGMERSNDDDDPNLIRADGFDFAGKRTDEHIELVTLARDLGLTTWFPAMLQPEPWMTEHTPSEFVERLVVQLERWRAAGCTPALVSPMNEPTMPMSGGYAPEWLTAVVSELGPRLDAAGLPTKVLVPDDVDPSSALVRATSVLDDPTAGRYVGALGFHLYGGESVDRLALADFARAHDLPLWMTEYSRAEWDSWPAVLDWASIIDELFTEDDVRAVDYMWGFFGEQQLGHMLVSIDFENGMYRSHRPTAAYWVTGQWSRWVRPGAVRVDTTVHEGLPRVSAFVDPDGGTLVAVAVNRDDVPRRMSLRIEGGATADKVRVVRSSVAEQWAEAPTLQVREGAIDADLPAASVTTFLVSLAS